MTTMKVVDFDGKEVVEVEGKKEHWGLLSRESLHWTKLSQKEEGRKEDKEQNGQEETPPGTFPDSVAIMQGGSAREEDGGVGGVGAQCETAMNDKLYYNETLSVQKICSWMVSFTFYQSRRRQTVVVKKSGRVTLYEDDDTEIAATTVSCLPWHPPRWMVTVPSSKSIEDNFNFTPVDRE